MGTINQKPFGAAYTREKTSFRLFAPSAQSVRARVYESDVAPFCYAEKELTKGENGCFEGEIDGDLHGKYYTYLVDGVETIDPYAKSGGANGKRGLIFDERTTDPDGWAQDNFTPQTPIVWEVHVRDFSSDQWLNLPDAGKFTAFRGGSSPSGAPVLLDYLSRLGITYVQLLPVMDFASVDELTGGYNWGYDPAHFFVPEGSYSSNPHDGFARVKELKRLVQNLHSRGIGVILDVVYNHVYRVGENALQICSPDVCFRKENGEFCNGSGCGNETKSESEYFRQVMIDSVCYYAKEYHIDGFRFDLMGLHDVQTMNELRSALDGLFPDGRGKNILLYGEPWYYMPPKNVQAADKGNVWALNERVGVFHDEFRDGVRGSHFGGNGKGFAQGDIYALPKVLNAILCKNAFGDGFQVKAPSQQALYLACHDDFTLFDQLKRSSGGSEKEVERMQKMAAFLLFSGLGIVFMQAGEEFMRSKGGNANSYNAGDEVNCLRWQETEKKSELVEYYRGLIAMRKRNPAFSDFSAMQAAKERTELLFYADGVAAYRIADAVYAVNNTNEDKAIAVNERVKFLQTCDIDRAGGEPFDTSEGSFIVKAHGVYAAIVL